MLPLGKTFNKGCNIIPALQISRFGLKIVNFVELMSLGNVC